MIASVRRSLARYTSLPPAPLSPPPHIPLFEQSMLHRSVCDRQRKSQRSLPCPLSFDTMAAAAHLDRSD